MKNSDEEKNAMGEILSVLRGSLPVVLLVEGVAIGEPSVVPILAASALLAYFAGYMAGSNWVYRNTPIEDIEKARQRTPGVADACFRLLSPIAWGWAIGIGARWLLFGGFSR